ncbi:hypothetical protein JCM17846_12630 [Iodidimonas nitroreducens]|uniref:Uncharacterized protein n=1 Tax=Iodidimonas nitroreducens TaxID=1236968 RepID=A0A5A7N5K6_9PROT|nr:hypothetical protein [Iodidimonas nitroreducens]GER03581.1 hypothetical protein JCM17846_12630 [Iodidimonas nitroreducens]
MAGRPHFFAADEPSPFDLTAKHLSFEANLRFIHNSLMQAYERQSAAEAAQKKQTEENILLGGSR